MTTDEFWRLAAASCTEKQLRVLELRERHGMSNYQIAYMTDRSVSTVRGHLRAAAHNISRADRGFVRRGPAAEDASDAVRSFQAGLRSSSAEGLNQARL